MRQAPLFTVLLVAPVVVVCSVVGAGVVRAQPVGQRVGSARSVALGGADVADARDARCTAPVIRPASGDAASEGSVTVGADFMPVPTGLVGSWEAGASGLYAVDSLNTLAASFSRYQYQDIYSADDLGAEYSRSFYVDSGRRAAGGVRVRYISETFGQLYLPLADVGLDLGVTFDLVPEFTMGASVTHLMSLYTNQGVEAEAKTEYVGFSWRPGEDVTIDAAVEADSGAALDFHAGVEYRLDKYLVFRAGTETATGEISAGCGIHYGSTQLDFAIVRNPDFGSTLVFGIAYRP